MARNTPVRINTRKLGLTIGILFSAFFLSFLIPETIDHLRGIHSPAERPGGLYAREYVVLFCGPLSLAGGTVLAFLRQRAGALWMLAAVLFAAGWLLSEGFRVPIAFLSATGFMLAPQLFAGILLLLKPRSPALRS